MVGNFWKNNYIEYENNGDRNLSVEEYFNEINPFSTNIPSGGIEVEHWVKPYLEDLITDLQKFGTWNIQLAIAIKFSSSKNTDEEQVMHSKSDNIEVMTYDNANKVIEEIFESLLSRSQIGLETLLKGSDFIFDSV